jgi:hypothetical protein
MSSPAADPVTQRWLVAALALAAACTDSPVQPSPRTVVKADRPRGEYTGVMLPRGLIPAAINSALMVVGTEPCTGCPWPYHRPVRWTPAGGTAVLPRPSDWDDVSVRDLNNLDQVAGVAAVGGVFRAVRWEVDDTPQALGPAYYIPGSSINDEGFQAWVQTLGTHGNPRGFDIRLWSAGTEFSLGVLPFDRDESGDYWAPFRLKADGTLVWGYGRWVYRPHRGWRQYDFPADVSVTSWKDLRDANAHGEGVGTGYRTSGGSERRQGYLWTRPGDLAEKLEANFLPELLTPSGLMAGHLIYPDASDTPPFQEAVVRGRLGALVTLPAPPPPPNYAFAWGWVFDLTDDGRAAVGSVVYYSTTIPPGRSLGGGIMWTRERAGANLATLATQRAVVGALSEDLAPAICSVPIAAASRFCADIITPLVEQRARH